MFRRLVLPVAISPSASIVGVWGRRVVEPNEGRRMLRVLSELRRPEQPALVFSAASVCIECALCNVCRNCFLRNILLLDWNICIVCILIIFYISPYTGDYS